MPSILNVSCYAFRPVTDPTGLRDAAAARAGALGLRGTVLVAEEGINLFVAGEAANARAFVAFLRDDAGFATLRAKESWSEHQPFRRLKVKVKREIIRMDHPTAQPTVQRAPAVAATTLRRWLDQGHDDAGRPVALLDTRNGFEVDCGTFEGAIDWRLGKFSDFPAALAAHADTLRDKTVVSFCTGGIRCEKAALAMREAGLSHVWQLEGGILQYFEETGGVHFRGHCFVFDERQALTAELRAAPSAAPDAGC